MSARARWRWLWLVLLACSVNAMAVEEPSYQVLSVQGEFEVRQYPSMLVAETVVEGDMDEASNKGFRLIADFIFGNNQRADAESSAKIAMTAPVTVQPQPSKIAMTAPVIVEPQNAPANMTSAQSWRVRFVMPSQYTLENIPKPKNAAVKLVALPQRHFVVHRYSGFNTLSKVQRKTDETLQWVQSQGLVALGAPQLSRYDPPWTLPMFKRNEIWIEIDAPSPR